LAPRRLYLKGYNRIKITSKKGLLVADQTYGISEVVGTSPDSVHQAIRNGVAKASQTVRNLDWFEVSSIRGQLDDGNVAHFQVQMKVGFRIE
jgi:dodecin